MADARERPIIFSAPMVRAILDGRKTQTRRIIKPQPETFTVENGRECDVALTHVEGDRWPRIATGRVITRQEVRWRPGDRAWVRETWARHTCAEDRAYAKGDGHPWGTPIYRATFGAMLAPVCEGFTPWRSPVHMPRWASRLTLLIEGVRVQRLQDISEEDAVAEGAAGEGATVEGMPVIVRSPIEDFRDIWRTIHGPDAWDRNPWVAALTFRAIHRNIDHTEPAHAAVR